MKIYMDRMIEVTFLIAGCA